MRDEVGVLIRLTYLVSNSPLRRMLSFLTRVLHSSCCSPNSISDQQVFLLLGPFLVENSWLGSMEIELAL